VALHGPSSQLYDPELGRQHSQLRILPELPVTIVRLETQRSSRRVPNQAGPRLERVQFNTSSEEMACTKPGKQSNMTFRVLFARRCTTASRLPIRLALFCSTVTNDDCPLKTHKSSFSEYKTVGDLQVRAEKVTCGRGSAHHQWLRCDFE